MGVAQKCNRLCGVGSFNHTRMLQYLQITLQMLKRNKQNTVICTLAPSSGSSLPCVHLQKALLCIHEAVGQHVSLEEL